MAVGVPDLADLHKCYVVVGMWAQLTLHVHMQKRLSCKLKNMCACKIMSDLIQ